MFYRLRERASAGPARTGPTRRARQAAGFGGAKPFNYFCYGAALSEVELDALTGDWHLLRTDLAMDVGDSLNPAIDIGQARARGPRACRVSRVSSEARRVGRAAMPKYVFFFCCTARWPDDAHRRPTQPGHDDAEARACRLTAICVAKRRHFDAIPHRACGLCQALLADAAVQCLPDTGARCLGTITHVEFLSSYPGTTWVALAAEQGPMAALQAGSLTWRCGPGRRRGPPPRAQVEGGFVQGLVLPGGAG